MSNDMITYYRNAVIDGRSDPVLDTAIAFTVGNDVVTRHVNAALLNVEGGNIRDWKPLTQKSAARILKGLGMVMRTLDGEHRVTFRAMSKEAAEAAAHYTNDLDDAVGTARDMAERHRRSLLAMPT